MQTYVKIVLVPCVALFAGCGGDDASENDLDPTTTEQERSADLDIDLDTIDQCTDAQRSGELKGKWGKADGGVNDSRCTSIPKGPMYLMAQERIQRHVDKKTDTQVFCILSREIAGGNNYLCIVDL